MLDSITLVKGIIEMSKISMKVQAEVWLNLPAGKKHLLGPALKKIRTSTVQQSSGGGEQNTF